MLHMVVGECADEEVRVIVAFSVVHRHLLPCLLGSLLQVLWQELALLVEVVACPDVDEDVCVAGVVANQLCGVVFCPLLLLVVAEVSAECLLAPVAVGGVGDGCECGYRLVLSWILEEQSQSSVSAH